MLCPTDLSAGGTWLGLNDRGVFAAITNRFGTAKDPQRRSRGQLVLEALEHDDAATAAAKIGALDATKENAFHLAIADRERAFLIVCDGTRLDSSTLAPGLHTITERSFNAAPTTREAFIREQLGTLSAPPDDARLEKLLGSHRDESFEGLCVHVPSFKYATRSSAIIRFGDAHDDVRFRFADGPPCTTRYEDVDTRVITAGSR